MNEPRISIIIQMYNAEKFIDTTIQSILNQTFKDFELIIVDDKSTDRSVEIVQSYDDSRIKLFRANSNFNSSLSGELGLSCASDSDYVYFVDHDDALMPTCLETLYNAAEESNADVVHMNSVYVASDPDFDFNSELNIERKIDPGSVPRWLNEDVFQRVLQEEGYLRPTNWNKIIRKKLFDDKILKVYPVLPWPGDIWIFIQELLFVKKILVIDTAQYIYRVHSQSTTHINHKQLMRDILLQLPKGVEALESMFESKNLLRPLTESEKINIAVYHFNVILKPYFFEAAEKLSRVELQEIIIDVFSKPVMHDPRITAIIFHILTDVTGILNKHQQTIYKSVIESYNNQTE